MNNKALITVLLLLSLIMITSCKKNDDKEPNNPPMEEKEISSIDITTEKDIFETYIKTFGRIYYNQNKLCLDHAATGLEIKFKGTKLGIDIIASNVTTLVRVFVDGDDYSTLKIMRNSTYDICSNLENTEHIVRIVKASSTASTPIKITNISCDGVILKHDINYKLMIEFLGDSITVGAGILGAKSDAPAFLNSDVTKAYSYLTALSLNADFSMVATEGLCTKVKPYVKNSNGIELYKSYSLNNINEYHKTKDNDVVVINLGANDDGYMNTNTAYIDDFYDDYLELVNLVRTNNPNSIIIAICNSVPMNSRVNDVIEEVVDNLTTKGDSRIYFLKATSNIDGASYHPGPNGAIIQAKELVNLIKEKIK